MIAEILKRGKTGKGPEVKQPSLTDKTKIQNIKNPIRKKSEITEMSKISIILDDYDDVFSDFDPRPYSKRSLSDDFLEEAKKITPKKTTEKIELKFLLPEKARNLKDELVITKRLKTYFRKKHKSMSNKQKKEKIKNTALVILGLGLMIIAAYVWFMEPEQFFLYVLIIIIEPAGWFAVWYGLDHLFYYIEEERQELRFYEKLAKANITFYSYM